MAFVSQELQCTRKPRTLQLTHWLRNYESELKEAIRAYFEEFPSGEEVTLAVFSCLGKDRFDELCEAYSRAYQKPGLVPERSVTQALGIFTAILLVELFGADQVQTLRVMPKNAVAGTYGRTPKAWPSSTRPVAWSNWGAQALNPKYRGHPITPSMIKNFTPHKLVQKDQS